MRWKPWKGYKLMCSLVATFPKKSKSEKFVRWRDQGKESEKQPGNLRTDRNKEGMKEVEERQSSPFICYEKVCSWPQQTAQSRNASSFLFLSSISVF
ncbi:hypothetical protein RUM43_000713 [Polyplax serrata]|uniref:Uncharacterized protein n=1 Tax=Polyplax serrata TaxID=468196 RepID=A0AAN8SGQ5_POLSC